MATEYRSDRGKWGYRFHFRGRRFKRYAWNKKSEAAKAERQLRVELESKPPVTPAMLTVAVDEFLATSAKRGRSSWRLDALFYNFHRFVLPYFGETTRVESITPDQIEDFIAEQKQRGVKNSTIWHYIVDCRAFFNWAQKKGLISSNPLSNAYLSVIKNRRSVKPPLDPAVFDEAADSIENRIDRTWFDVTRFVGMRKDESNRLEWRDINWEPAKIRIPGTKTGESETWLPLAPVALKTLRELYESEERDPTCPLIFPGRSAQTKNKKVYSRRRMFERIRRITAVKRYQKEHPDVNYEAALEAAKKENFKGGIKITPKDLRDYFGTEIAHRVNDPNVVMRLMRHTSLTTTTKYLRTVEDRMKDAVSSLGANVGGNLGANSVHLGAKTGKSHFSSPVDETNRTGETEKEIFGGGGQTRTVDSADMSRVL